jgi:hypothetical protein
MDDNHLSDETSPSSLCHTGAALDAVNIARVEQLPTRPGMIFHADAGSD